MKTIDELIAASSLGDPEALAVRAEADPAVVACVLARAGELDRKTDRHAPLKRNSAFPKRLPSHTTVSVADAKRILGVSSGVATAIMRVLGFHNAGRAPRDMFVLSESFTYWGRGGCFPDFVPPKDWALKLPSVYFIGCNDDRIKIGCSRRVSERLSAIQTGCPYPVSIVAVVRGDKSMETALHHWFREYRTTGEWFRREGALAELLERAP